MSRALRTQLGKRLRWLIAIRLLAVTSVLLPYILLQIVEVAEAAPPALKLDFIYLLAGASYAASLVYIILLRTLRRRIELQAHIQFLGDLLLITALVYYFGGVSSPFSILYLIVVIAASTLVQRRTGVLVAVGAWVLYAAVVLAIYGGMLESPHGAPGDIPEARLIYYLATHLFGFLAVAIMTSRLARSVSRAERELIAKREDLADLEVAHRDVIQSIPSGLITTDLAGTITSVNFAGCEILGRREAELVGRPIVTSGLLIEQEWRRLGAEGLSVDERRREVELEVGGEVRTIGFSLSHLTSADGRPSGRIVIFQDLSDWRKLREELRLKDRMAAVGELASGIAHEIGNPLAAISGSVQMLSSSIDGDSSHRKLLDITLKESQRLDRTIKGFLKFARPKERSSVPFDIAQLLTDNVELLRNSPEVSDHHQLIVDLSPPEVSIVADPDQISQLFWNLARNALRAMPEGGRLRIQGTLEGATYSLQFIDEGRGMTEEERTNLFHPFKSHFDGGTGIGMAIVYQIVQEHGGRLRVDSRPGKGTEITVELPARPGAVAAEA